MPMVKKQVGAGLVRRDLLDVVGAGARPGVQGLTGGIAVL